jgi:hypothetical protein
LNSATSAEHLALASRLFATISENVIVLPEEEIDAFTTFGSTTTATIYVLLDALITAGSLVGLRHQASHARAIEQVIAAARNGRHRQASSQLLDELCTPGGVTVEGVKVLEERAVRRGHRRCAGGDGAGSLVATIIGDELAGHGVKGRQIYNAPSTPRTAPGPQICLRSKTRDRVAQPSKARARASRVRGPSSGCLSSVHQKANAFMA